MMPLLPVLVAFAALRGSAPVGRGGGGAVSPPRGRGRGLRISRPSSGRGEYVPPENSRPSGRQRSSERERELDIFGPKGEWRARKDRREWNKYQDDQGELQSEEARPGDDRLVAPADFAPKVWRAEAGGGKGRSFFAQAPSWQALGASDEKRHAESSSGHSA